MNSCHSTILEALANRHVAKLFVAPIEIVVKDGNKKDVSRKSAFRVSLKLGQLKGIMCHGVGLSYESACEFAIEQVKIAFAKNVASTFGMTQREFETARTFFS